MYFYGMKNVILISLACLSFMCACHSPGPSIDIQGHRGARGHLPENTIPSFLLAIEQGATTLELDLALSADSQLIISHEPWISPVICIDSLGNPLSNDAPENYNLFEMAYADIQKFDCGSKPHPRFPDQTAISSSKPLFSQLLDTLSRLSSPMPINVEIKSRPEWDSIYYPSHEFFADHLVSMLSKYNYQDFTTIQSFDIRPLNYLLNKNVSVKIALLVSENEDPLAKIDQLSTNPDILSPHHQWVDADLRGFTHAKNMSLIPWTVNDTNRMSQLIDLQVDGVITDYPDRLVNLIHND